MKTKTVTAIIVAAGSSTRMGFDKLFYPIQGKPVLEHSIQKFSQNPFVQEIVIVAGNNQDKIEELVKKYTDRLPIIVTKGGSTRAESVKKGLACAKGDYIAIHDGARPFVSQEIIHTTIKKAWETGAAAPAVPVKDTIKITKDQTVESTPNRDTLYAVQTPQVFLKQKYQQALQQVADETLTDDCQLLEQAGMEVYLTQGSYENYKITTPEDLKEKKIMRIGHGYDVHKLVEDRLLILGGETISYKKGLLGHSDADVLCHAVMDAVLGAVALGDIGKHFPDTDPKYKGANSIQLTKYVTEMIQEKGWRIGNIDATVVCQAPKLAPHILAMRKNLAEVLQVDLEAVSVKATTEEKLGFTGSGEGIAVHAVALLEK